MNVGQEKEYLVQKILKILKALISKITCLLKQYNRIAFLITYDNKLIMHHHPNSNNELTFTKKIDAQDKN
ncbi:unnamed protein product [Paramecium pentaurelia]|uniref:Uncharacterized protein n=1 Tax=Paramecium pentaurelia TaxID=43138 RepID=A0A8S1XCV0_9CILI|nr:unnamed protein product [Paramecium pentaurelia]